MLVIVLAGEVKLIGFFSHKCHCLYLQKVCAIQRFQGRIQGAPDPKNEAPAPKFYKIEALELQF